MNEISVPCGICGQSDSRRLYGRPESSASATIEARITTDTYDNYGQIVECRRCGLVFRSPRPPETVVVGAYADLRDDDYLIEENSRAINAHLSMHFIQRFKKAGRLLDVGCFTGHLLNAARLSFDPEGVEPSRWAAGVARERMKLSVTEGTLSDVAAPAASYDVITMVDVIEHFSDPAAALRKARALLKPDGLLYLVTPNIRSLSARLLGRWWWGLRSAHLVYFSPETLTRMLNACGFEVVEMRSYGRLFTYGYWVSRLKNYPGWIYRAAAAVVRRLGVSEKVAYVNTFDSIELAARSA